MIRRLMLTGLGAGLAAPGLLRIAAAQQPVPQRGATTGQAGQLDQVTREALGAMASSLASSEVAEQRAETRTLQAFAGLETAEQEAFTEARRMAGLPTPSAALIDPQDQQMLQRMQALRGAEFDRAYLAAQMRGHEELLRLHRQLARSGPTREDRILGTVAVPSINSHLAMLRGIEQQMRG